MGLTLFEAAFMLHLIAVWLLQNEWMSVNKVHLSHQAVWVHAGIPGILLGLLLGWAGGITLGVLHILIDSRVPVRWWIKTFKKCEKSPDLPILLIGTDQVLHLTCIAGWIILAEHWK